MNKQSLLFLIVLFFALCASQLLAQAKVPKLPLIIELPKDWSLQSAQQINEVPTWTFTPKAAKGRLSIKKGVLCDLNKGPKGAAVEHVTNFSVSVNKWQKFCRSEGLSLPTTWTFEANLIDQAATIGKARVASVLTKINRPDGPIVKKTHWFLFSPKGPMWQAILECPEQNFAQVEKELAASLMKVNEGGAK